MSTSRVVLISRDIFAVFNASSGVRVRHLCHNNSTVTCGTHFVGRIRRRGTIRLDQTCHRQLSTTNIVLTDKELNDDALPTNSDTQIFSSESIASGAADSSVTNLLANARTEDFAALGLGGHTPSGLIQSALEFLHVNAHLPWWASIAVATVAVRLALFPLVVRMQRNAAKIAIINPVASELHKSMTAYKRIGNKVAEAQEAAKLMSIYQKHGVNPLTALFVIPLLQIPVFISFFLAIKGMTKLPLESMKMGGVYWFTDLTVPDPTYVLPLMACLAFISNIEVIFYPWWCHC